MNLALASEQVGGGGGRVSLEPAGWEGTVPLTEGRRRGESAGLGRKENDSVTQESPVF